MYRYVARDLLFSQMPRRKSSNEESDEKNGGGILLNPLSLSAVFCGPKMLLFLMSLHHHLLLFLLILLSPLMPHPSRCTNKKSNPISQFDNVTLCLSLSLGVNAPFIRFLFLWIDEMKN